MPGLGAEAPWPRFIQFSQCRQMGEYKLHFMRKKSRVSGGVSFLPRVTQCGGRIRSLDENLSSSLFSSPHLPPVTSTVAAGAGQSKWLPITSLCLLGWTSWVLFTVITCSLPTCGHTGTANTTGREDVPGELGLAGGEPLSLAGCPQSLCPVVGSGLGSRVWAWHLLLHLQSDMTLHHLPGHLLFSTSHLTSCPTVLTWKSDWCPRLYSSQALLWTFRTSPSIPSFPTSVNSCFYLFLSDPRPVS